jgi:hypothetical protein
MGGVCIGLEEKSASIWECMICKWVKDGIWDANRERDDAVLAGVEPSKCIVPAHSCGPLCNRFATFEAHCESETHRRCVKFFLSGHHSEAMRGEFALSLDHFVGQLSTIHHRDRIRSKLYLYVKKGRNEEATRNLISAMNLLQTSMKQDFVAALALGACKQLAVTVARNDPINCFPPFISEEDVRSFLQGRKDEWKRHKAAVLEGGCVELIVSLVLPFLPEFTRQGEWNVRPKTHKNALIEQGPSEILVQDAGSSVANGLYRQNGLYNGGFKYLQVARHMHEGELHKFYLLLCNVTDHVKEWFISTVPLGVHPGASSDTDYYRSALAADAADIRTPPRSGWLDIGEGIPPAPRLQLRYTSASEYAIWWE